MTLPKRLILVTSIWGSETSGLVKVTQGAEEGQG